MRDRDKNERTVLRITCALFVVCKFMSRVKILSLNVRGLRKQEKRRAIFCYLKKQKASIFCLEETFSKKEDENIWRAEWGGHIIFSHGSEHSKGVCILVEPNGYRLETIETDEEGRYILANLKLATENLFVVNVYAPTDCRLQTLFLKKTSPIFLYLKRVSRRSLWQETGILHLAT